MLKPAFFLPAFILLTAHAFAQDSVWVKLRPKYNDVSGLHRVFFGENYRKEWSGNTLLPVIDLSKIEGGLRPVRLGGGHQTVSLRMISSAGKEWVLRNIEKDASVLLPLELRKTFASEIVDDAMSAQHPFSPLVVSVLAEAVNVPHAHPEIGVVKQDTALGEFNSQFAGRVCLIEEREPIGKSENTLRLFTDLSNDPDNQFDGEAFLRARMFDMFIGDWDRHADQWRWTDVKKGKEKLYVGIPRDRDQAFYKNEGVFPWIASRPWIVPSLQGFRGRIKQPKFSLKEGAFMNSRPALQMPYEQWMRITEQFTAALTDEVIENALRRLPEAAWKLRHEQLLRSLRERRDNMRAAMNEYYRFAHRIVEIQLSDKSELISITNELDSLHLHIRKKGKKNEGDVIVSAGYSPAITKEIRIYSGKGNDSTVIDNHLPVRIRIIGDEGNKGYTIAGSDRKVRVYGKKDNGQFYGATGKLVKHLSDDTANTKYVPINRYNIIKPVIAGGFNRDDGFILGLGFQYTHQGFRKVPYASMNRLVLYHSFATAAYKIRYSGEWLHVIGKTDLVASADIFAPENTQNFFGRGNETVFNKKTDISFYRARFSLMQFAAGVRWRDNNGVSFTVGPALQHYSFDSSDNKGRFIARAVTNSYDSSTISKSRTHAGLFMDLVVNKRNNPVIPSGGYYLHVRMQAYAGANGNSKSFGQLIPEFSVYRSLNAKHTIVIADRLGGGISAGNIAYYQSLYAGGHENLMGYRQYRFAGDHTVYNNLEARIKLANFRGYIVPGEFGMLAFYDIGRVWVKGEDSGIMHQGAGGGLYFAPAKLAVLSVVAGYSKEGWYPYITLGFRF